MCKTTRGIRCNQCEIREGRSCLSILISFSDRVTCLMDERMAVNVVYLCVSKAFDTISHSTLLETLVFHSVDGCILTR